MSVEEETADELGRRGVEDKQDKLRDVAEGDKQVDTEINREPQMRKRKRKTTWKMKKTQRNVMLKIHTWRGKHLGWNPKKSM